MEIETTEAARLEFRLELIKEIEKRLHCLDCKNILQIACDVGIISRYEYNIYLLMISKGERVRR